jgi:hypothetical protein
MTRLPAPGHSLPIDPNAHVRFNQQQTSGGGRTVYIHPSDITHSLPGNDVASSPLR